MTPDWSAFNHIPFERRFSISKANLIDQCPLRFHLSYIRKIKEPLSDSIFQGTYFEWLIAGKKSADPCPQLSQAKRSIIDVRYEEYSLSINPNDRLQIPIIKEIPGTAHNDDDLGNYFLIGFLDRQESETSETDPGYLCDDGAIIDHKVSGKPWDIQKFTYSRRQAQGYVWATGNPSFRFDVINMQTPEIQAFPGDETSLAIFKDWISSEQLEGFVAWLQGTIRIMRLGNFKAKTGPLCNWCYYKKLGMCKAVK